MEFKAEKKEAPNKDKYLKEEVNLAYTFARKVWKEFSTFSKAIVLFGSKAKQHQQAKESDIDVLIILDDVSYFMNAEIVEKYRVLIEKLVLETSKRIHVTSMNFTTFWDYVRVGDPLAINILRDGVAMVDTGFFYPMQMLLFQGRIRPTKESILAYYSRAPAALYNSRGHLVQGTLDLYWAAIDAAHAALMTVGEIPPAPSDVAKMLEKHICEPHHVDKKHARTMDFLYHLSRKILHHHLNAIRGKDYDLYYQHTFEFVQAMKNFIKHHHKSS